MSCKNKLNIPVTRESFQQDEKSDFYWRTSSEFTIQRDISRAVFDDERVVSILNRAFECGLNRRNSWNLNAVPQNELSAFEKAAQVFKRGVNVRGSATQASKSKFAQYCVEKVETLLDCFALVRSEDVVIVDENVEKFWWHRLPSGYLSFGFSEAQKNLEACAVLKTILMSKISKSSKVFVVGGGVAGDVTGFVCGLLGVEVVFIPTTLLSMVDSSIGGKVGVNFEPWGKNQIGLFNPPHNVRIWSGWLSTLDRSEFLSGMSEAVKHAIIVGNHRLLQELLRAANTCDVESMSKLIIDVLAVKASIVARDPFEQNERAVLNFGHTLGHVLETLSHQKGLRVTHGACVAVGMVHALLLSQRKNGGDFSQLIEGIKTSALIADLTFSKAIIGDSKLLQDSKLEVMRLLLSDKKSIERQQISYVLPDSLGNFSANVHGEWTVKVAFEEAWSAIEKTWEVLN